MGMVTAFNIISIGISLPVHLVLLPSMIVAHYKSLIVTILNRLCPILKYLWTRPTTSLYECGLSNDITQPLVPITRGYIQLRCMRYRELISQLAYTYVASTNQPCLQTFVSMHADPGG